VVPVSAILNHARQFTRSRVALRALNEDGKFDTIGKDSFPVEEIGVLRWLVWGTVVTLWTLALELPVPPTDGAGVLISSNKYLIAKSIHVVGYGVLTFATAWLPLAGRFRIGLLFFLMAHATLSEFFQLLLEEYCHRSGSLADVCFDQCGILAGMLLRWKWWSGTTTPTNRDAHDGA
jgi:VanZ family protein